jgi:ABC-type transport system involved in multi-copper enzyme maturation permease subunit
MRVNPVLERELRERPRTAGAVVMLTVYLAVLTGIFVLVYEAEKLSAGNSQVVATSVARIGQGQFEWVLFFMLLLVLFLVPGYTASSIAGERERQTLIPMQLTLLRPSRIVSGKAAAAVAYLALLIVATAPLLALSFVIGGVSLSQVARGLAAVLFVGVVLSLVTVACSAVVRRVAAATLLAYTVVLALLLGTLALWGGTSAAMKLADPGPDNNYAPEVLAALNPVMFVSAAIDPTDPTIASLPNSASSPFTGIRQAMHPRQNSIRFAGGPNVGGQFVPPAPVEVEGPFRHFLWWSLASHIVLALLCWRVASRRLRTPAPSER